LLDGFNCFLPEVRALPFARQSTPVGGFLRVQGWGTANDTSRGGVRARVSAPISVAFFRAIIERGASMGPRQRPRGSSRARARATAPRPRVFSPIFPPSVLTRSPVPSSRAAVQVLHRDGRQGGRAGAPIRPARSPAARPWNVRARIDSRRVFFPARLSRRRAAPAPDCARIQEGNSSGWLLPVFRARLFRFQPSADRWAPRAPRRAARPPRTPRLTLPRNRPIPASQETQPTIGGGYNLLKRIRKEYSHDERPYHAFLAILIRFRNAEFTTEQVRARPRPSRAIPATVPERLFFSLLAREARRDALPPPRTPPPRPPSRRVTPRRLAIPCRRRSQVSQPARDPALADSRIPGSNFQTGSRGFFFSPRPVPDSDESRAGFGIRHFSPARAAPSSDSRG
jgi:hypothetical protein